MNTSSKLTVRDVLLVASSVNVVMYVFLFTADVPYYDEWAMVPLIERWLTGAGNWADLVMPRDGHRIIAQNIAALFSAFYLGWDVRFEIFLGLLCLILTAILITRVTQPDDHTIKMPENIVLYSLIPFLILNLRQWQILLGPWSVTFYSSALLSVASLYYLSSADTKFRLLKSSAAASIASAAFTQAIVIWPIGFFLLSRLSARLFWLLMSSIIVILFAISWVDGIPASASTHDGLSVAYHASLRFFAVLGFQFSLSSSVISGTATGPIQPIEQAFSIIAGIVLAGTSFIVFVLRRKAQEARFGLALIAFGIASCFLVAVARSGLDLNQAMSSRYYAASVIITVGIVVVLCGWPIRTLSFRLLKFVLAMFLTLVVLRGNQVEWTVSKYRLAWLESWRMSVLNYEAAADRELANPHFTPTQIREFARFLDEKRLSLFRHRAIE